MKIALLGNVCNNLYRLALAIREHSTIEVDLFLDANDDFQATPGSDIDPESPITATSLPPWIHTLRYNTKLGKCFPFASPLVKRLRDYDLIIVSGDGPLFAQATGRPWIFFVTGADLTVTPFPLRYRSLYATWRGFLARLLIGFWQQVAFRRNLLQVWTQPYRPFESALRRIGVPQQKISPLYFPLVIDPDRFKPDPTARTRQRILLGDRGAEFKFLVFHPARIMLGENPLDREIGSWKQNDILFHGFADFVKKYPDAGAGLAVVERDASPDVSKAKALVSSLGIDSAVLWLTPPRPGGFDRRELVQFYSLCDVTADDFGIGWFGSIVLEALSAGCPVLSYIDEAPMKKLYPWHPILSANTRAAVFAHLERLYLSKKYRDDVAAQGLAWIKEFHSPATAGAVYINVCRSIEKLLSDR